MSQQLSTVVEQLRAEENRLASGLEQLRHQVRDALAEQKQIRRALAALSGASRSKTTAKRPAPTRNDVVRAMIELLQANGALPEEQLKQQIAHKLQESGKSRAGFALRYKEALADGRFSRDEQGVRLLKPKTPAT
jgi:hypothetical protein